MLERVQEQSWLQGLGKEWGLQLHGASKALAQWAIVDDYNTVLDLSCRDTRLLRYFSHKYSLRACGIASENEEARLLQKQLPEAEIFCARPGDIPWQENTFDVVFCQLAKSEGDREVAALREALRVLRPCGQLLIAVKGLPEPICSMASMLGIGATDRLHPRTLLRQMENAGFDDVSYRTVRPCVGLAMGWKRN